jgi:DNA repair exonuclease SbcCD ATPase subunit
MNDEFGIDSHIDNAIGSFKHELRLTLQPLRDRLAAAERERDEARASEVEAITDQAMREIRIARLTEALEKAREELNRIASKADLSLDGWPPSVSDIPREALMAVRNEARSTISAINAALKGDMAAKPCPLCDEENTPLTTVWSEREQGFVCEDCWRPGTFTYWGA